MRVDGSLSNLASGVTTLDKNSLKGSSFAKEQTNFRTDDLRGLIKRPPLELIGRVKALNPEADIIEQIIVNEAVYFLIIDRNDEGFYDLQVFNEAWEEQVVTTEVLGYVKEAEDLTVVNVGETTLLVDRRVRVTALELTADQEVQLADQALLVTVNNLVPAAAENGTSITGILNATDTSGKNVTTFISVKVGANPTINSIAQDIYDELTETIASGNLALDLVYTPNTNTIAVVCSAYSPDRVSKPNLTLEALNGDTGAIKVIGESVDNVNDLPKLAIPGYVIESEISKDVKVYLEARFDKTLAEGSKSTLPGAPPNGVVKTHTLARRGTKGGFGEDGPKLVPAPDAQAIADSDAEPRSKTIYFGAARAGSYENGAIDFSAINDYLTSKVGPPVNNTGYPLYYQYADQRFEGGEVLLLSTNQIRISGLINLGSDEALDVTANFPAIDKFIFISTPSGNLQGEIDFQGKLTENIRQRSEGNGYVTQSGKYINNVVYVDVTIDFDIGSWPLLPGQTYNLYVNEIPNVVEQIEYEEGKPYIYKDGFLTEAPKLAYVRWVETYKRKEEYQLNPETLPVALVSSEYGHSDEVTVGFTLTRSYSAYTEELNTTSTWSGRQAGDNLTSPFPEFLGHSIRDAVLFQSRLALISGDRLILSRTNRLYNFWRETVTNLLPTDTISLGSVVNDGVDFDFMTLHNRDLLVFSGTGQYKMSGGQVNTPQNAALPRTANFEYTDSARPISNGVDVYFPFSYGDSAGVGRYIVRNDIAQNDDCYPVSDLIQGYIPGKIISLSGVSNLGMLFAISDSDPTSIYVGEFATRGEDRSVAWSKWQISQNINVHAVFTNDNALFVAYYRTDVVGDRTIELSRMKLRDNTNNVLLDSVAAVENVNVDIPIPQDAIFDGALSIVAGEDCPEPYKELTYSILGTGGFSMGFGTGFNIGVDTDVLLDEDQLGGTVFIGYKYKASYIPHKKTITDESGNAMEDSSLSITNYLVSTKETIELDADIKHDYIEYPTKQWRKPWDEYENKIAHSEEFHIPFRQQADQADLEISSWSTRQVQITNIEWRGTYNKRGRRS